MQSSDTVRAVLFDYGLVLSGPPDPASWARMRTLTGHDEPTLQAAYWAPRHEYDRGTHTGAEFWELVAGHPLDSARIEQLLAADVELWGQPNQPMIDWATALQRAGVPTGILSNMGDAMTHGLLARFDWLADFDHHTWSHTLKIAKPEAAIYAHAAEGLGMRPAHILFIDDREDNIAAAQQAGMQTLRYIGHAVFEDEMKQRGLAYLLDPKPASV